MSRALRLFLALWPPPAVLDELATLPRPHRQGVRWTPRENLHVTLRFLGTCEPDEVARQLEGAPLPLAEASLRATELLGRRLLVAPVDGVDALARAVTDLTADVGDPPPTRPFRGHVTLARIRPGAAAPPVGLELAARWACTEVSLVRSRLDQRGATYATVRSWQTHADRR